MYDLVEVNIRNTNVSVMARHLVITEVRNVLKELIDHDYKELTTYNGFIFRLRGLSPNPNSRIMTIADIVHDIGRRLKEMCDRIPRTTALCNGSCSNPMESMIVVELSYFVKNKIINNEQHYIRKTSRVIRTEELGEDNMPLILETKLTVSTNCR